VTRVPALAIALLALGCGLTPERSTLGGDAALLEKLATLEAGRAAEICAERRGAERVPQRPFTSDGCSSFPDSRWAGCCVDHDVEYWCGGSEDARETADGILSGCASRALGGLGPAMHFGVWIGGAPWVPAPWRWGYGWDYPAGYASGAARRAQRGEAERSSEGRPGE
jgi:hypothetical protein